MSSWRSQINLYYLATKADIDIDKTTQLELILNSLIDEIENYTGLDFDDDVDEVKTKTVRNKALFDAKHKPLIFKTGAWQTIKNVKYFASEGDSNYTILTFDYITYNYHKEGKKETSVINEIESLSKDSIFEEHSYLEITGKAGYASKIPADIENILVAGLEFFGGLQKGKNIESEKDLTSSYSYATEDKDKLNTSFSTQPAIKNILDKYKVISNYPS